MKALEMEPTSPMVRLGRASWFLVPTRRLEEALVEIRRAVALDPLSPAVPAAELWILYTMKKRDAAQSARALIQLFPSLPICRFVAGLTLLHHDCVDEAAAVLEEGLRVVPGDAFLSGILALARARQGRLAEAQQIRSGFEEQGLTQYIPFLPRAYSAEACGVMVRRVPLVGRRRS